MKIAILFSNYMYSYIQPFLDFCLENNIDVDFFKFAHDKISFPIKANNVYVINTKWRAKKFNTNSKIEAEIKNLVNISDYDYFLSDTLGLSFHNACNFFHGHSTKYKIEHTSNGLLQLAFKLGHFKLLHQEAKYYQNTKFCFVGSNEMKIDYAKNCNISPDKIKILRPGKDNILDANIMKKEKNDLFIIGSVTCGFQLKGGYNILNAIKILKKSFSYKQIRFKLVNPNFKKQWYLKLYLKILGIEKYVEFLPYQNNINNFYSSIDCLVCASNAEAFGRVVTEAMMFGVPVIAGTNVGAAEIIEHNVNGYLFQYGKNTAKNLAETIKTAYEQRNDNNQLVQNAKQTANGISWEIFTEKLLDVIFCN